MRTTRRLTILGAAALAAAGPVFARPQGASSAPHNLTPSELLAIGRGALAAQARKD